MITIRKISAEATYSVRHNVLRKGKPIDSCRFEGDELPTTNHYGLFDNDKLQAIISLFENSNPIFEENKQTELFEKFKQICTLIFEKWNQIANFQIV